MRDATQNDNSTSLELSISRKLLVKEAKGRFKKLLFYFWTQVFLHLSVQVSESRFKLIWVLSLFKKALIPVLPLLFSV